MTFVVDCSAVVDLLVAPDAETVHSTVGEAVLHAPTHLDTEVVSALRGQVLGGHLSRHRAADALTDYYELRIHRWPLDLSGATRTLDLADNMTSYDAAYVILAEGLGCPLLTRDRRLSRSAEGIITVMVI